MIDYEITVDVSNVDIETKKRVQDAYFKLGFVWSGSGSNYNCLDKECYTNASWYNKKPLGLLMWTCLPREPTHTVDELLELAGMKKQNAKPFDLEKALAGEPVVTRNGKKATQITLFESKGVYPLVGVVDGDIFQFTKEGVFSVGNSHALDLFMKVKTHMVNGFEVPTPEIKMPELGKVIYLADPSSLDFCRALWFDDNAIDHRWLERGLIFLNPSDAIINAKAMIGINPYDE